MASIHRDEIVTSWCPKKYITGGSACNKSDSTLMWEDGSNSAATLNPSCCKCVKEYYLWPFYILGIFSVLFALCAAIVAASLFYLSDNSDHYGVNKLNDGLDFAFLGLALLLIIGFGLYFLFRTRNKIGDNNNSFAAFNDSSIDDPNFERVKDSVVADALGKAPNNDGFYPYDEAINPIPNFNTADTTCSNPDTCIMRYQALARNAVIVPGDLNGAQLGGEDTRLQFFPDCTNSNNGYFTIYGTEEQVQGAVRNLKFDIINLNDPNPNVLTNYDQQDRNNLNNSGLV